MCFAPSTHAGLAPTTLTDKGCNWSRQKRIIVAEAQAPSNAADCLSWSGRFQGYSLAEPIECGPLDKPTEQQQGNGNDAPGVFWAKFAVDDPRCLDSTKVWCPDEFYYDGTSSACEAVDCTTMPAPPQCTSSGPSLEAGFFTVVPGPNVDFLISKMQELYDDWAPDANVPSQGTTYELNDFALYQRKPTLTVFNPEAATSRCKQC